MFCIVIVMSPSKYKLGIWEVTKLTAAFFCLALKACLQTFENLRIQYHSWKKDSADEHYNTVIPKLAIYVTVSKHINSDYHPSIKHLYDSIQTIIRTLLAINISD